MSREVHVQFCESLGVQFPGATQPGYLYIFPSVSGNSDLFKLGDARAEVTGPSFCTTANERVYITASGCETEFVGTRGL